MRDLKKQVLANLPEKGTKRARKSLYLDTALTAAFEKVVGKGRVSIAVEELMRVFLEGEKKFINRR